MIYLVPLPKTKLTRRSRVPGWSYIKLDKAGKVQMDTFAAALKSAGITRVYSADIHKNAAEYLAGKLGVPNLADRKLRGFNVGRNASQPVAVVDGLITRLLPRWTNGASPVPIVEGDSWTSYYRRFVRRINELISANGDVVVVLDPREIAVVRKPEPESLLSENWVSDERMYRVKPKGETNGTDTPVESGSTRPAH